jgi:predicted chitinase/peptidoglycan hydrolase-like protein with peptidoglycan-binding domain
MGFAPTRAELARMFPRGLGAWLDALEKLAPDLIEHYGMTRLRWIHFAGQIAAETDSLSLAEMQENMNYTSASRILQVYSHRLGVFLAKGHPLNGVKYKSKAALAQHLVRKPTLLADIVYGGREQTPFMCGSKFVGRGPLQTTHLANYRAAGEEVAKQPGGEAFDLVGNPELLSTDPELGIRVAFAEWELKGLNRWADCDDCETLSDVLNTGRAGDAVKPHGLPRRLRETARAKAIWSGVPTPAKAKTPPTGLSEGARGDQVRELQSRLKALGYLPGAVDGAFGVLTGRAVRAFQAEHGLEATGVADMAEGSRFRVALEASAPADLGAREAITEKDLKARGSTQVALWSRVRSVGNWGFRAMLGVGTAEATGLDVLDGASSATERIVTLVGKVPPGAVGPRAWLMLAIAVAGLSMWLLSRWAQAGIDDRVAKARSGEDISK